MTRDNLLVTGICAAIGASWFMMTLLPQAQLGGLQPQVNEEEGDIYPINVGGVSNQGRAVYVANGCFYCHTQQVKDGHAGTDLERKWGLRRSVARDYIYDRPVVLGAMRIGPDLANIGLRHKEGEFAYSPEWHYLHLYNPQTVSPGSIMPPYRYLFIEQKIVGERSVDALNLKGPDAPPSGYEIVPNAEAKALVGYLQSLQRSHALPEVKGDSLAAVAAPEAKK